jgi:aminopeptidase N
VLDRASEALRRFVPDDQVAIEESLLLTMAVDLASETVGERRLTWARTAVAAADSAPHVERLRALVDEGWARLGFDADQEMRWQVAIKAAAFGLDDGERWLDGELRRDHSDRGQRAYIRGQAALPERRRKSLTWERIHGSGYGSDYLTRAAILGFQWVHQRDVLAPFRASFYDRVRDHAFATAYARGLAPDRWAEPAELHRLRAFSGELGEAQGLLRRHLDEIGDDMDRAIRVRAFAASAGESGSTVSPVGSRTLLAPGPR